MDYILSFFTNSSSHTSSSSTDPFDPSNSGGSHHHLNSTLENVLFTALTTSPSSPLRPLFFPSARSPSLDPFNISRLSLAFHSIPHVDIKLGPVNNTFDPADNEYLESLGILVAIPGFWLILTLLFFLIFFLCRCCDNVNTNGGGGGGSGSGANGGNTSSSSSLHGAVGGIGGHHLSRNGGHNSKKKDGGGGGGGGLTCCKCFLFLFALLSMAIIGVGFLGHFHTHGGLTRVINSTRTLANMIDTLRNETNAIEDSLEANVDEDLNKLSRKLIGPLVRNYTVLNILQDQLLHMRRNVTKGINRIGEINSKIERLDLNFIPAQVTRLESIRFGATLAILTSLALICFILLCGICRHSRCLLILFSVLGLLSLVICWVLTSLYLGFSVAASDFCFNPKPFLHKQFAGLVDTSVVTYYLSCDNRTTSSMMSPGSSPSGGSSGGYTMSMPSPGSPSSSGASGPSMTMTNPTPGNPFRKQLRELRKSLDGFDDGLFQVVHLCEQYCPDNDVKYILRELTREAKKTQEGLLLLNRISECQPIYFEYLSTMESTCRHVLEGLATMLFSAAATGVLFTLLVLCASHTWINIRKKRGSGGGGDDGRHPLLDIGSGGGVGGGSNESDPFLPQSGGVGGGMSTSSTATSSASSKRLMTGGGGGGGSIRGEGGLHGGGGYISGGGVVGGGGGGGGGGEIRSSGGNTSRPVRFSHTPPQTPHFATPLNSHNTPPSQQAGHHPGHPGQPRQHPGQQQQHSLSHPHLHHNVDQLAFLTPPPSYDQVGTGGGQHPHGGTGGGGGYTPSPSQHGVHYVADTDLMMRATQATKF